VRRKVSCSNCGRLGHNKKGCKAGKGDNEASGGVLVGTTGETDNSKTLSMMVMELVMSLWWNSSRS